MTQAPQIKTPVDENAPAVKEVTPLNVDLNFMSGGYDIGFMAEKAQRAFVKSAVQDQGREFTAKPLVLEEMTSYGTALTKDERGLQIEVYSASKSPFFKVSKDGRTARANPETVQAAVIGETAYIQKTSPILRTKCFYTLAKPKFEALYK